MCLVIFIFHNHLFFMLSVHTLENEVMLYVLSMTISLIFPLWHCYYLNQVMLKQTTTWKIVKNLNGLAAHEVLKVSLIEAFVTTYNFDFKATSSKWCNSDTSNMTGIELDNITTWAGYSQLINEPSHFVNKTSSCIDLIFSSDLNITRNCGIDKIIHKKCHRDIIYREIWDCKQCEYWEYSKSYFNVWLAQSI